MHIFHSKHTEQLSLVTSCDKLEGIEVSFWTHGWTDSGQTEGQRDVEVEIVI